MKIKRLLILVLVLILALLAIGVAVWTAMPTPAVQYTRLAVGNLATQIGLSFFTFVAVCISLWVAGINRYFVGPDILIKTAIDELHCVLSANTRRLPGELDNVRLTIYVHAENSSSIVAEDCRLTCNKLFVSVDGLTYYKYKNIQTASLRWVYPNLEDPYSTTLRKRVEKFARIVQIVERVNDDEDSSADDNSEQSTESADRTVVSWIEVCLPLTPESSESIRIPTQYRAVLIPLTIVSRTAKERQVFCQVVWRGDSVRKYAEAGYLGAKIISEGDARLMINKEGE